MMTSSKASVAVARRWRITNSKVKMGHVGRYREAADRLQMPVERVKREKDIVAAITFSDMTRGKADLNLDGAWSESTHTSSRSTSWQQTRTLSGRCRVAKASAVGRAADVFTSAGRAAQFGPSQPCKRGTHNMRVPPAETDAMKTVRPRISPGSPLYISTPSISSFLRFPQACLRRWKESLPTHRQQLMGPMLSQRLPQGRRSRSGGPIGTAPP